MYIVEERKGVTDYKNSAYSLKVENTEQKIKMNNNN